MSSLTNNQIKTILRKVDRALKPYAKKLTLLKQIRLQILTVKYTFKYAMKDYEEAAAVKRGRIAAWSEIDRQACEIFLFEGDLNNILG